MNRLTVREAVYEAQRFLEKAGEYLKADGENWEHPKENGAVRRASMDLTRALAVMRRPG